MRSNGGGRRIGILMTDGLGDVICASGLVADIRAAWPDAHIGVIVRSAAFATVLRGPTRVDRVITYDPQEGHSPLRVLGLLRAVRRERFDTFVVITCIDRHKAPCLAFASGASVRVGEAASIAARLYTRSVPRDTSEHKVLGNRAIVALLGITPASPPVVAVSEDDAAFADAILAGSGIDADAPFVAVHPGSSDGLRHKRWEAERYEALLRRVAKDGAGAVLVGAGSDVEICDSLLARVPSVRSVAGRCTVMQTAAVLARASVVVGADSGVMHLAAAVGTPTVVMFGPTDERWTSPFAATSIVTADLPCRPCFARLPYGCGQPVCMSSLTVNRVHSELRDLLRIRTGASLARHESPAYVD